MEDQYRMPRSRGINGVTPRFETSLHFYGDTHDGGVVVVEARKERPQALCSRAPHLNMFSSFLQPDSRSR